MSRKITVVFVLALFVLAVFSGGAFAAKAKYATSHENRLNTRGLGNASTPALPLAGAENVPYDPSIAKPGQYTPHQALGFNPTAVKTIGSTYQDYQSNGSMGRRIVVGNGWVHNVIMVLPAASTANRVVEYDAYPLSGAAGNENPDIEGGTVGAGYPTIDFINTNVAVPVWHRVSAGGTRAAKDFANGAGSFTPFTFPVANCQGIVSGSDATEGPYIWPYVAADVDGGGQPIIHVVAHESPTTTADLQSLVYYRSNAGVSATGPTCGFWIDSVDNIASVIAADPNSQEIAIVFFKQKDQAFAGIMGQANQNVWYKKSLDGGVNWQASVNLTQYDGTDLERAYTDCDALYTSDGCLHIAWTTSGHDSVAGTYSTQAAKLRHWDDCVQCISLALDANNFDPDGDPGAWNRNIAKMNLSECTVGATKRLYLTYTRFQGDEDNNPPLDHSAGGYANGEIFAQASNSNGQTWGPPVNLTNTNSNNCAAGACFSEHWSSSAMYVTDSLRIFYVEDKDAGGIVQTEGSWQNNPVKNMSHPCFTMTTFVELGAAPAEFSYPYHTAPAQVKDEVITLSNSGNATAAWSVASNAAWLTFVGPTSGNCTAGCTNTSTFTARITGPGTQGHYSGVITVTYSSPDKGADATLAIPIELDNFTNYYLPVNAALRTNINRLNVNQASQLSDNETGKMFSYFADTTDYLYEGHLIIGNSATNLTYSTFDEQGAPTVSNPYGYLYAADPAMTQDSTGSSLFRKASGKGVNRDSTVGFTIDWYGSKHPDSGDFYVGAVKMYKGPKNPTGTISGLSIAYYTDWDIPSDSGSDNVAGFDASRSMVTQKGAYSAPNDLRIGATAAYRNDGNDIIGGWVLDNPTYIYPEVGYENDSLWNIMSSLTAGTYRTFVGTDDLSGAVLIYRNASINGASNDTLRFVVVIAGTRNGGLTGINTSIDKAKKWICSRGLAPTAKICVACKCGDADNNGLFTISDAVYLISYIFAGGPAPAQPCLGDADGNNLITISDAVYLISYIFAGGPAPHCP